MNTRKSMTLPIIITLIVISIIVYFFASIKQSKVTCEKVTTFDGDIKLIEELVGFIDGKSVNSIELTKTIILPEKYSDEFHLNEIMSSLDRTLEYLGDNVKYTIVDNKIIVKINVNKNELVLLDNISFSIDDDLKININSNTKSSDVITLSIGDNYTDGEFMKRFKNSGYSCK